MSHEENNIICPNCGFNATRNYCAQCGQETHLHKDTFLGLTGHFIGHYFHYDSKFWQTLKTMMISPGKLTLAYMDKQRMRYIPPISLYIFVSAVYFLISFTFNGHDDHNESGHSADSVSYSRAKAQHLIDSLDRAANIAEDTALAKKGTGVAAKHKNESLIPEQEVKLKLPDADSSDLTAYLDRKAEKIEREHGSVNKYVLDKLTHNMPKYFFFMIPLTALVLKLLYLRRKDRSFVDHTIFSMHYHSFWFSLFALTLIDINSTVDFILYAGCAILAFVYMVRAMKVVYGTGILKASVKTVLLAMAYALFFVMILLGNFLVLMMMA